MYSKRIRRTDLGKLFKVYCVCCITLLLGGCIAPQDSLPSGRIAWTRSRIDGFFQGFQYQRIYELQNGQCWEQLELYNESGNQAMPEVVIWSDYGTFRMQVAGMGHQVIVRRAPDPETESEISGDFDGLEYGKAYELENGEIWEQIEYRTESHSSFGAHVKIWNDGGSHKMKIDDMDEAVRVRKIENATRSRITSKFSGFSQGNRYELENGEIWEQKQLLIRALVRVAPRAIIWQEGSEFRMKISGIPYTITVNRVN